MLQAILLHRDRAAGLSHSIPQHYVTQKRAEYPERLERQAGQTTYFEHEFRSSLRCKQFVEA